MEISIVGEDVMNRLMHSFGCSIVGILSDKYGFQYDEGVECVCLLKCEMEVARRPPPKAGAMVLPFCGIVESGMCRGIRLNHGLYTQCTNVKMNGMVCKT